MKKILLSFSFSMLMLSANLLSLETQSTINTIQTKRSPLATIKQVITDFPELNVINENIKNLTTHLKDILKDLSRCSISVTFTYDAATIKTLQNTNILEAANQLGDTFTVTINQNNQLIITVILDAQDTITNEDDEDDFTMFIQNDEELDDATQKATAVQSMSLLIMSIEILTIQIDEAIASLNKAESLDAALAEKLTPLFSVLNLFPMVEQFAGLLLNQAQIQALCNYQAITFSLNDENDKPAPVVSEDLNKLFETILTINKKLTTDTNVAINLQNALAELTTAVKAKKVS